MLTENQLPILRWHAQNERRNEPTDNGFDGAPCTSEQTLCDDGACCATGNWCCYGVVPPPYKTEMTVNGRTCYEKMRSDQDCGSKDSDAAAPRAGMALLAGAALAVAAA